MRIGLIFDRAVEFVFRHWAPIAMTMVPAVAIAALLYGFPYVALPYDATLADLIGRFWQSSIAQLFSAFAIWFCCAAVVIGVRWIALGYPTRPFYWLQFTFARLPAIAAAFAVPLAVCVLAVLAASVFIIDPAPEAALGFLSYLNLITFVGEAIVLQPIVLIMTVVVAAALIDDLSFLGAMRAAIKTAWDRAKRRNFIILIAALYLVNAVAQGFVEFADPYLIGVQVPSVVLIVVASVLNVSAAVFCAVAIAVAWLSGYIGPRGTADVRALTDATPIEAVSEADEKR